MKPIAVIGDSWATGPAPGQPNLGETLAGLGIPSVSFQLFTTGDVLAALNYCVATGQTGKDYSAVFLSIGAHDMAQGIPDCKIIQNLIAIGNDCAKLGLKCEVLAFPQIAIKGNQAYFTDLSHDWYGYDLAAKICHDLQVIHGAVGTVLENFPVTENIEYSQYVPHYNQLGAEFLVLDLIGLYRMDQTAPQGAFFTPTGI